MTGDRRLVWALLTSFVSAVAAAVFSVVFTGHSNQTRDRQWCELLSTLDVAYSSAPPATELGRRVAAAIAELTQTFGCDQDVQ